MLLCIIVVAVLVVAVAAPSPFILIAPAPICLAVLGVDNSNCNHFSSLIILLRKLLAHLQNSWPYPSADTKGGNHHDRLDSVFAAATTTTTTTIIKDREMTLVHSCSGGMICWVHSLSLSGYRHPAASQQWQQGGKRRDDNFLGHWHLAANHCQPPLLAAASTVVNATACHHHF